MYYRILVSASLLLAILSLPCGLCCAHSVSRVAPRSLRPYSSASRPSHGGRDHSVKYLLRLSRFFDCFDFILEWDGMSGMEVVFDSLIFLAVLIV